MTICFYFIFFLSSGYTHFHQNLNAGKNGKLKRNSLTTLFKNVLRNVG